MVTLVVLVVVLGMVMVMVISGERRVLVRPRCWVTSLPCIGIVPTSIGAHHMLFPPPWSGPTVVPGKKRGEDDTLGKGCIEKHPVVQIVKKKERKMVMLMLIPAEWRSTPSGTFGIDGGGVVFSSSFSLFPSALLRLVHRFGSCSPQRYLTCTCVTP